MAEALAMKEGLILANAKGCNSVIAEGDQLETIQACEGVMLGGRHRLLFMQIVWISPCS
jgi:hypothetical protein